MSHHNILSGNWSAESNWISESQLFPLSGCLSRCHTSLVTDYFQPISPLRTILCWRMADTVGWKIWPWSPAASTETIIILLWVFQSDWNPIFCCLLSPQAMDRFHDGNNGMFVLNLNLSVAPSWQELNIKTRFFREIY